MGVSGKRDSNVVRKSHLSTFYPSQVVSHNSFSLHLKIIVERSVFERTSITIALGWAAFKCYLHVYLLPVENRNLSLGNLYDDNDYAALVVMQVATLLTTDDSSLLMILLNTLLLSVVVITLTRPFWCQPMTVEP